MSDDNMYGAVNDFDSRLFEALSNCNKDVYFYYADLKKNISRWSHQATEYFGLPSDVLNPASLWDDRILPSDKKDYDENMAAIMRGETPYHNCEYRIKTASGEYVWVNCRGYVIYDKDGAPEFFAGYVQPMGQITKLDSTTRLWTFYMFRRNLTQMLSDEINGAALVIDISDFKRINSHYGYQFGDDALYTIAQTIVGICDSYRIRGVYRYLGAKIVILGELDRDDVMRLRDEIYDAIEHINVNGTILKVTIACGATMIPQDGSFFENIDNNLVTALTAAKLPGVSEKIVFYSSELVKRQNRIVKINDALQESINDNFRGFSVVFQPVFDAKTGKLHAAEALLRWTCDEFPNLSAAEFVPLLERSENIIPVGRWIVDKALSYVSEWRKRDSSNLPHININFSYIQFQDPTLKDYIIKKLDEYGLPHDILVAELTESCRLEYSKNLADILQELKDQGISIALDDFGTGYASLMLLKEMPTDIVKLDHTMMATIHDRPKDRGLVEFIIKYCNEIGIDVCTEGVETKEIQDIVTAAGTAYLQGYYYDKPLKTDAFFDKYIK